MRKLLFFLFCVSGLQVAAQEQVNLLEKMLATSGNMAGVDCVDDDFSQTIFFAVPIRYTSDFYLRVWDPDCGGENDLPNGLWETNTQFEIFGGPGCFSEKDARSTDPIGNYKSGNLLDREIFARESDVDNKWVAFGPFTVDKGEQLEDFPGYAFFKTIVEGRTGDDTNLYSLFVSSVDDDNIAIEDVAFFCYESACWKKNEITVLRSREAVEGDSGIFIPIELIPQKLKEIGIIAEPVKN